MSGEKRQRPEYITRSHTGNQGQVRRTQRSTAHDHAISDPQSPERRGHSSPFQTPCWSWQSWKVLMYTAYFNPDDQTRAKEACGSCKDTNHGLVNLKALCASRLGLSKCSLGQALQKKSASRPHFRPGEAEIPRLGFSDLCPHHPHRVSEAPEV